MGNPTELLKCWVIPILYEEELFIDETNRPSGSPLCHRDGNRQDGKWTHQVRQVRQVKKSND